ncbi:MAG: class I SAM-dependent methyltransferase [Bacteroidetes bacterium]|nr:class I SAM-dependent methyltransferase [Bacteroidota bacterium]MCL5025925.1 class I SAM-dependent methyltransferase [Chloroflexota bacterium]
MNRKYNVDYDAIANVYAANRDASGTVVSHLVQFLRNRRVRDVLEVGCGTGGYLLALVTPLTANGYGFDRSAGTLDEAFKKSDRVHLAQADAEGHFPFREGSFDLVFSVNVIHYIKDLAKFRNRAYSALRLISDASFESGLTRLTMDVRRGDCIGRELYTYVWGHKPLL